MYLNRLNNEQKELFLDICIHAAMSNKDFAEEQKNTIQQYCAEMDLQTVRYAANTDFEQAVDKLIAISANAELRMVAIEVMGLIVSDKKFDEFEKEFMKDFVDRLGIDHSEIAEMLALLKNLVDAYNKINQFVFEA